MSQASAANKTHQKFHGAVFAALVLLAGTSQGATTAPAVSQTTLPLATQGSSIQVSNLAPPAPPAKIAPGNLLTPDAEPVAPPPMPVPPAAKTKSTTAGLGTPVPVAEPMDQKLEQLGMKPKPALPVHPKVVKNEVRPYILRHQHSAPRAQRPVSNAETIPSGDLVLSNSQLNVLRFPEAIKHLWFPANTPIIGKPAYFAQDHAVMLQFQPGVDSRIQLMVELQDGAVISREADLRPIPGATYALNGTTGELPGLRTGQTAPSEPVAPDTTGMAAVRLLQGVVQGRVPRGFDPAPLPAETVFTGFTAHPVMTWKNSSTGMTIYVFVLKTLGTPASISPPEFYRPGVEAVLLTADTVSKTSSPFLYVVEAADGR